MNDFRDCIQKEEELEELEHAFRTVLLQSKSSQQKSKELLKRLSEVTLSKLELERMLEVERRETSNLKAQLNLIQSQMKEWEQARCESKENVLKQNIQLEFVANERNTLAENIKKLQVKIMELKTKEDAHNKLVENQKKLENVIQNHKTSMNSLFESISTEYRKLEVEQNELKKSVKNSANAGQVLLQLLNHHHNVLNETFAENEKLKEDRNRLSSELEKIKASNSFDRREADGDNEKMMNDIKNCEAMIMKLNNRIERESEEKAKLNELLKKTLNEQVSFFESGENTKERIVELEKIIESYKKNQKINKERPSTVDECTQTEE